MLDIYRSFIRGGVSLIGVEASEFSNWWSGVRACFDELAPDVQDLAVPVDGRTVVALLFETSRVPLVVRNAAFGQKDGGPVEREVPWREGTAVRSARRSDLLRILVPAVRRPDVMIMSCRVEYRSGQRNPEQRETWSYRVELELYLRVRWEEGHLIFADHDADAFVEFEDGESAQLRTCQLRPPDTGSPSLNPGVFRGALRGHGQLVVRATTPVLVHAESWKSVGPKSPNLERP